MSESACPAENKQVVDPDIESCAAWPCPADWNVASEWSSVRSSDNQSRPRYVESVYQ